MKLCLGWAIPQEDAPGPQTQLSLSAGPCGSYKAASLWEVQGIQDVSPQFYQCNVSCRGVVGCRGALCPWQAIHKALVVWSWAATQMSCWLYSDGEWQWQQDGVACNGTCLRRRMRFKRVDGEISPLGRKQSSDWEPFMSAWNRAKILILIAF